MNQTQRLRPHKSRRVTDEQIRVLRSWVPFYQLARSMGISVEYARKLRAGEYQHKSRSP
jgi:hypothetical protein